MSHPLKLSVKKVSALPRENAQLIYWQWYRDRFQGCVLSKCTFPILIPYNLTLHSTSQYLESKNGQQKQCVPYASVKYNEHTFTKWYILPTPCSHYMHPELYYTSPRDQPLLPNTHNRQIVRIITVVMALLNPLLSCVVHTCMHNSL